MADYKEVSTTWLLQIKLQFLFVYTFLLEHRHSVLQSKCPSACDKFVFSVFFFSEWLCQFIHLPATQVIQLHILTAFVIFCLAGDGQSNRQEVILWF